MELTEIQNKVINYLNKKGISVSQQGETLIWNYSPHYSEFRIKIYFGKKMYYSDYNIITYGTNNYLNGINKKKTTISNGFCYRMYKILMLIKKELDENAEKYKKEVDLNTKYCTELERYYKRSYNSVTLSTHKNEDKVEIFVNCTDSTKRISHRIIVKDNTYFLVETNEYFYENPFVDVK